MADLTPNPLVLTLVNALQKEEDEKKRPPGFRRPGGQLTKDKEEDQIALGEALASLPDMVTFAGYVGGVVDDSRGPTKKKWLVLYPDTKLVGWLLVEADGVVYRHTVTDQSGDARDVIWVRADASVGRGRGAQTNQERFLRGDFTAAGDFTATPAGGTTPAATGLLVDATTPGCCGFKSR